MYYSETKVIMGGLAHVPILIFIVNIIKGKFESIASKVVEVKTEEPKLKKVFVLVCRSAGLTLKPLGSSPYKKDKSLDHLYR